MKATVLIVILNPEVMDGTNKKSDWFLQMALAKSTYLHGFKPCKITDLNLH